MSNSNPAPYPDTFESWYERLRAAAERRAWNVGSPEEKDMWREYFDDGDSPDEALKDDIEHA